MLTQTTTKLMTQTAATVHAVATAITSDVGKQCAPDTQQLLMTSRRHGFRYCMKLWI